MLPIQGKIPRMYEKIPVVREGNKAEPLVDNGLNDIINELFNLLIRYLKKNKYVVCTDIFIALYFIRGIYSRFQTKSTGFYEIEINKHTGKRFLFISSENVLRINTKYFGTLYNNYRFKCYRSKVFYLILVALIIHYYVMVVSKKLRLNYDLNQYNANQLNFFQDKTLTESLLRTLAEECLQT